MSQDYLNNTNQTSLLFKRFQNKVQANPDTGSGGLSYANESKNSLTYLFNNQLFSNTVSNNLTNSTYWINVIQNDSNFASSTWDSVTNDVKNQIIASYPIPGTDLIVYKDVYLEPVQGTNQAWYIIPQGLSSNNTENNKLKNMIPYNYNPLALGMFTPIISYWNGTSWFAGEVQNDTSSLNWLIDYESGVLEFYQTNTILESKNINQGDTTDEKKRPRITCICYNGGFGSGGGSSDNSGNKIVVGTSSGGIPQLGSDVSAIYFDDSQFNVDISNNIAIINSTSTGGGNADLSFNFFDIPLSPTDGSGSLDSNYIKLNWKNPVNTQSALPFGKFITYGNDESFQSLQDIRRLPFFQHLHIEYMPFIAGQPTGDLSNNNDWIDLSNNSSNFQTIIPNTLESIWLTNGPTDPSLTLLNTTGQIQTGDKAPYSSAFYNGLILGYGYQFRIYLDNSGINLPLNNGKDILYGQDVSWNYLYIPDVSFQYIDLGAFGPAYAPTSAVINFTNFEPSTFEVVLSTTNPADTSLNTPFPINPNLDLEYSFAIDISAEIEPTSYQQQQSRYDTIYGTGNNPMFSVTDFSSVPQRQSSVEFLYSELINDLSVCPQTKYTYGSLKGVNTAFVNDPSYANVSGSTTTGVPSNDEAIDTNAFKTQLVTNGSLNAVDISLGSVNGTNPSNITVYPGGNNLPFPPLPLSTDILFLDNTTNFTGIVETNDLSLCANNVYNTINGMRGKQTDNNELSYFDLSFSTDISGSSKSNPTKGFLQNPSANLTTTISNEYFYLKATAQEAGKTPVFQYQGYYSGINLNNLNIRNINLNSYPDICNNSYNDYEFTLKQYYNLVPGTATWNEATGSRTVDMGIGKYPETPINWASNTYSNPTFSNFSYLMGLGRPNSDIPVIYSFKLSDIDPTWVLKSSYDTLGGISKTTLLYAPEQIPLTTIEVQTPYIKPFPNLTTIPNIDPSLEIGRNFFKVDYNYSRKYTSSPQFRITGQHLNNVSFSPDISDIPFQDVSFGTVNGGQHAWWDYTWNTITPGSSVTTLLPPSFFTSIPDGTSSIQFIEAVGNSTFSSNTTYNHIDSINFKQLMWSNQAFRGNGFSSSNSSFPYIDFSNNFYNPNSLVSPTLLRDYSIFDNSGQSISKTYSAFNPKFWTGQPTSGVQQVSRTLKFITFNIDVPQDAAFPGYVPGSGASYTYIFELELINNNSAVISHDSALTSTTANGYWVFYNQLNSGTSTGPYDGQGQNTGTTSGSYFQSGYRIPNPSLPGNITTLQISIGLPNSLNSNDSVLSSVAVNFKAIP